MATVPSGWGVDVHKGGYYATVVSASDSAVRLACLCASAGLKNTELVCYCVRPDQLLPFIEGLEGHVTDLKGRVSRGQLMQQSLCKMVNTWVHGGPQALQDLLGSLEHVARRRGFSGLRLVIQDTPDAKDGASPLEWHGMQRAMARIVSGGDSAVTIFSLYRDGEIDEALPCTYIAPNVARR